MMQKNSIPHECVVKQESVSPANDESGGNIKPPIGIMPKKIADKNRFNELCGAITRYYQAGLEIKVEWINEYNEYVSRFSA